MIALLFQLVSDTFYSGFYVPLHFRPFSGVVEADFVIHLSFLVVSGPVLHQFAAIP